jgi:hypothetical protein
MNNFKVADYVRNFKNLIYGVIDVQLNSDYYVKFCTLWETEWANDLSEDEEKIKLLKEMIDYSNQANTLLLHVKAYMEKHELV